MGFAKLTSSKQFCSFYSLKVGEFFQYSGDVYIKTNAQNAINLLKTEGDVEYFDGQEKVEDAKIEIKVL